MTEAGREFQEKPC